MVLLPVLSHQTQKISHLRSVVVQVKAGDITAETLANQLTLLTSTLFHSIHFTELLGQAWMKQVCMCVYVLVARIMHIIYLQLTVSLMHTLFLCYLSLSLSSLSLYRERKKLRMCSHSSGTSIKYVFVCRSCVWLTCVCLLFACCVVLLYLCWLCLCCIKLPYSLTALSLFFLFLFCIIHTFCIRFCVVHFLRRWVAGLWVRSFSAKRSSCAWSLYKSS